jgi:hypothetical protein
MVGNEGDSLMPKYNVDITRTLELSTCVTVTAKTEDEAEAKALMEAHAIEWTIKDTYDWDETTNEITIDSVEEA